MILSIICKNNIYIKHSDKPWKTSMCNHSWQIQHRNAQMLLKFRHASSLREFGAWVHFKGSNRRRAAPLRLP